MATLKTRIQNKYGTSTEWSDSTLQLLKGELAIMPIAAPAATNSVDGTGLEDYIAGYMIKVGDGKSTFSSAKGLVAYAADVHSWAKAKIFDEGNYDGTADGNLPKTHAAIKSLQEAIGGSGSVAQMIAAAIDALDVTESKDTDTVNGGVLISAISEADGKISVTRRNITQADITEAVKNLARTDLVNIDSALTAIEGSVADVKETIGGDYSKTKPVAGAITAIDSRLTTEEAATTRIDGEIDALEGRMNTAESNITTLTTDLNTATTGVKAKLATAEGEIDVLQAALAGYLGADAVKTKFANIDQSIVNLGNTDDDLDSRLQAVEGKIGGVTGAMHFIGASAEAPSKAFIGTDKERNLADGDVYVNTSNHKEYVYSGTEWVELGDVTDEVRRISDIEKVLGDYTTAGSVKAAIAAEAQARETADSNLDTAIGTVATNLATEVTNRTNADAALQKEIDDVEALIGAGFSATESGTVAAKLAATTQVANAADALSKTNANDIDALKLVTSGYSGEKAIKNDVDSVRESARTANEGVTGLTNAIGTKTDSKDANTVYGAIAKHSEEAAATYATQTALSGVSGRVTTIESKYVYSDGTNLRDANGEVIIFDCGGVNE